MTNVENKVAATARSGPTTSSSICGPAGAAAHPGSQAVEDFLDIFNVTNRANFDNPSVTSASPRLSSS